MKTQLKIVIYSLFIIGGLYYEYIGEYPDPANAYWLTLAELLQEAADNMEQGKSKVQSKHKR